MKAQFLIFLQVLSIFGLYKFQQLNVYNMCPGNLNCRMCNPSYDTCYLCKAGAYMSAPGICKPCYEKNCEYCYPLNTCLKCKPGYFPISYGSCSEITASDSLGPTNCPSYCDLCSATKCVQCYIGFHLTSSGQCDRCTDTNCLFCPNDVGVCVLCNLDSKGYAYKVESNF